MIPFVLVPWSMLSLSKIQRNINYFYIFYIKCNNWHDCCIILLPNLLWNLKFFLPQHGSNADATLLLIKWIAPVSLDTSGSWCGVVATTLNCTLQRLFSSSCSHIFQWGWSCELDWTFCVVVIVPSMCVWHLLLAIFYRVSVRNPISFW